MAGDEQLSKLEEKYDGYTVNDRDGDKIGKVDELFVDDTDREEYIGVKMGLLGLSGTTLIPMEIARVDERDRVIEVAESKERVKDAPTYSNDNEVNDEFEDTIRDYFGLAPQQSSGDRGSYGVMSDGGSEREGAARGGSDREEYGDRGEDREQREGPSMERGEREGEEDRGDLRDDREEGRMEHAEPHGEESRGEESRGGEFRGGESRDMEPSDTERRDVEPRGEGEDQGSLAGRSGEGRGWDEEEETSERMRVRRRTRREESSSFEQEEEEEYFSR